MAKWQLLVERASSHGEADFVPTGVVVETDDPHGAVMAAQARDGRCYGAVQVKDGWWPALGRVLRRMVG